MKKTRQGRTNSQASKAGGHHARQISRADPHASGHEQPPTRCDTPADEHDNSRASVCVPAAPRFFFDREWHYAAALVLAVLLAYQPAWHGGLLWDDNGHVTRPDLRTWHGLYRIWFEPGATQQYYPLLHSAFWIEHRLWGDATLGYHLVNILLHCSSALMVVSILRRLAVPGAWLAAAVFALHPVHVESVAWITEQKNTLSGVLYLGAMMAYLRFDRERRLTIYLGAVALFVLALLSKSVTATLPAALLVIFWWQRGRLSWRRDVSPLLPLFVLGVVAGLFTAWAERTFIGAVGAAYDLSLLERCLIAGRAFWFYLGKLIWPVELVFIYPRWVISSAVWWQYVFPVAALLLAAGAWALRRRWRWPLVGLLFFGGTLFPALGFLNVFPFVYSFVADHFQYLASLGIISMAAGGVAALLARRRLWGRMPSTALCLGLLAVMMCLTWRQSLNYRDIETLYQKTIDKNPDCWMAHNNLGNALAARGETDAAISHFQQAMTIKPDYAEPLNNLGNLAGDRGQLDAAIAYYRQALAIDPDYAEANNNLGNALARSGALDEAITHFRKALKARPDLASAYNNLGNAYASRQQFHEAIANYRKALAITPDHAAAQNNLGMSLTGCGEIGEAIVHYRKSLELAPDFADAHNNLGNALASSGQFNEAIIHYRRALEIRPDNPQARHNLNLIMAELEKNK